MADAPPDDSDDSGDSVHSGDAAAVLAANRAFYDAFNAHDVEAMADLWSQRTEVTCIHPHRAVLIGRDDVLRSWRAIITNPDQPRIVFAADEARLVGDVGIVAGREVVAGIPIVATNVYVREDGVWRLIHHHGSPVLHQDG